MWRMRFGVSIRSIVLALCLSALVVHRARREVRVEGLQLAKEVRQVCDHMVPGTCGIQHHGRSASRRKGTLRSPYMACKGSCMHLQSAGNYPPLHVCVLCGMPEGRRHKAQRVSTRHDALYHAAFVSFLGTTPMLVATPKTRRSSACMHMATSCKVAGVTLT